MILLLEVIKERETRLSFLDHELLFVVSLHLILLLLIIIWRKIRKRREFAESGGLNSRVNNYYERERNSTSIESSQEIQELERDLSWIRINALFLCCWRMKKKMMQARDLNLACFGRKWMKREKEKHDEDDDDDDGTQDEESLSSRGCVFMMSFGSCCWRSPCNTDLDSTFLSPSLFSGQDTLIFCSWLSRLSPCQSFFSWWWSSWRLC